MKGFVTALRIVSVGMLLAAVVVSWVASTETVAFLFLWFIIAFQALTVVNGVAVFWTDYACSLTNKVVYAAFAIVSAAIYIKICFFLLDLLKAEVYGGFAILMTASVLAVVEVGLSLTAKRFLLNIPFPSLNGDASGENENDRHTHSHTKQ